MWHTCPTAATEAGCCLMPFPALWAMPFMEGLPLLLPCACQYAPSCADAILSYFQSGMEAGLSQSRGWCGQHPSRCVFSAREREQGQLLHRRAASLPHAVPACSPGRKTVSSILDILTKQRQCLPWFCLDIFHGVYFQGWL